MPSVRMSFYEVLSAAVNDIASSGYDSQGRLDMWIERLKQAATDAMIDPERMETMLRNVLSGIFTRLIDREGILKTHDIAKWTIAKVRPQLRAELDRRLMASAQLIKLNRTAMINKTIQRFSGWATSIPDGGSKVVDKMETKDHIKKALRSLPFEERRVLIDQGHKLEAALSDIVATSGGAIALRWRSHWRQPGYDYREDHKERDQRVYAIRDNWAIREGLMRAGDSGYYDRITAVGEEVFCRCFAVWIYSIRRLPDDMLTAKGRAALQFREIA